MEAIFQDITWFDALLVTLWAGVVVLGLRRGLGGVVWVAGLLLAWPLVTWLSSSTPVLALPLAIVLGVGVALLPRYLVQTRVTELSHAVAGGVAGLLLGFILLLALALGFPIKRGIYPSDALPPGLQQAVGNSLIVRRIATPVFSGPAWIKRYLAPDRLRARG